MKTAGREAGKYCVVVDKADPGFVMVTGPRNLTSVKRRKCNVHHLEPLVEKLEIKAKAADEEVAKAFMASGLAGKLGLKEKKVEPKQEKKAEPKEGKADSKKEHKPEKKATPKKEHKPEKKPARK